MAFFTPTLANTIKINQFSKLSFYVGRTKNEQKKDKIEQSIFKAIVKASIVHQIPVKLIEVLIEVESGGGRNGIKAVSSKNAMGLTQMLPSTAKEMGVKDIFNIEENVLGGVGYLKKLIDRFDSVFLGLCAYNWGPQNVKEALAGEKLIPVLVWNYADRIILKYESSF